MQTNRKTAKAEKQSAERYVTFDGLGTFKKPYTRKEVARLLGRSVKTVDYYAAKGVLVRVMSASCPWRCIGFTAASVRALVEGRGE